MNRFGLLLCLSTYLLVSTDVEAIVGGYIARPQVHSYQVSLQQNGQPICGGAIISGWHILTAAHCVTQPNGQFKTEVQTVVAGAFDLMDRGPHAVTIAVEKVYIPRVFTTFAGPGDIAVLKLRQPLPLGANPMLSQVVLAEDRTYIGMTATVTGYGWTWIRSTTDRRTGRISEQGGAEARKRKYAMAVVLPRNACQHSPSGQFSNTILCARVQQRLNMNEGVCNGDSGGPLVLGSNVIIGVLSNSPVGCDERKNPASYTRVSAFRNFIVDAMTNRALNSMRVYEHGSSSRPGPTARPTAKTRHP